MDAETERLFDAAQLGHVEGSHVTHIIRHEISRALATARRAERLGECLLADFGEYFVEMMDAISHIAHALANGGYIREYTRNKAAELANEADLHTTDYLDEKHLALK